MNSQDKINYQRKATFDQHVQSNDFTFMDGSQECEDAYTLGFVTACMWITKKEIEQMKEDMRRTVNNTPESNLITLKK